MQLTALVVSSDALGAAILHKAMQVTAFVCPVTAPPIGAPVVVLVYTKSGIVISASFADTGPKSGVIVAVGDGEQNYKGEILPVIGMNIGDTVYFPEHTGTEIEDEDGTKYLLINSKNILAIKA